MIKKILAEELRPNGFVLIKNIKKDSAESVIKYLGKILLVTDVKLMPLKNSKVFKKEPIAWHNDAPEAQWIAWHCYNPGSQPREATEILDGLNIQNIISNTVKCKMRKIFTEVNGVKETSHVPMLLRNIKGVEIMYFCPWLVAQKKSESVVRSICKAIKESEKFRVTFYWEKHDLLIIDNNRYLHRRGRLAEDSARFLRRYWIGVR